MSPPKPFDLPAALRRMGGSVPLLTQVIGFFCDDAPALLSALRAAQAAGDLREVQLAAHSLKGLVVNFDADVAATAAIKVESFTALGNTRVVDDAIGDLEKEVRRLMEILPMEVARLQPQHSP